MKIACNDLSEITSVATKILKKIRDQKIVLFIGEMGAGKTTLIAELCKLKGVVDKVSSPTFSIVNEYLNSSDEIIYHFDFYRLKDINEALDMGIEEYLGSEKTCYLEWPELIKPLLPETYITIKIEHDGDRRFYEIE